MTHGNRHLDDDLLEQYSMGNLPESKVSNFEEHLLLCELCQQRLDETDAYVAGIRSAAAEFQSQQQPVQVEPERGSWGWLRLIPALATVALLVAVIGWRPNGSHLAKPPFAISLEATRGVAEAVPAPADTWLLVRLDLAGLPVLSSYQLDMVNASGNAVWHGAATAHDAKVESKIPETKAGTYFLRVSSPSGELLREFGLKTRDR